MAFNHYAKIKRILDEQADGWVIRRIDQPTTAKNFKNETVAFTHYYRIFDNQGNPIKYCKFQQIERLAQTLNIPVESLPILTTKKGKAPAKTNKKAPPTFIGSAF